MKLKCLNMKPLYLVLAVQDNLNKIGKMNEENIKKMLSNIEDDTERNLTLEAIKEIIPKLEYDKTSY